MTTDCRISTFAQGRLFYGLRPRPDTEQFELCFDMGVLYHLYLNAAIYFGVRKRGQPRGPKPWVEHRIVESSPARMVQTPSLMGSASANRRISIYVFGPTLRFRIARNRSHGRATASQFT